MHPRIIVSAYANNMTGIYYVVINHLHRQAFGKLFVPQTHSEPLSLVLKYFSCSAAMTGQIMGTWLHQVTRPFRSFLCTMPFT